MFANGDAYRLWHYRVDPHYFPRGWRALGPKYGLPGRLWYGSPEAIRGTVIVVGAGNVGVRVYVMIMDDDE